MVALISTHSARCGECVDTTCAVAAPAVAYSIKPPGVASRLLYGERDQTASRTGHTGCACTLRAPQRARTSRVCPRGLGQAPAVRICSRRTTHAVSLTSTSPAPLTVWARPAGPAGMSETVSPTPQLGPTHFLQQNCIFQPTEYDTHARFIIKDL